MVRALCRWGWRGAAKDGCDGNAAAGGLRRGCAAWYGGERAAKHGCDKDGGDGAACGGIAPRGTKGGCLAVGLFPVVRRGDFRVWG